MTPLSWAVMLPSDGTCVDLTRGLPPLSHSECLVNFLMG